MFFVQKFETLGVEVELDLGLQWEVRVSRTTSNICCFSGREGGKERGCVDQPNSGSVDNIVKDLRYSRNYYKN